jgi:hypothetical protein
MAAPIPNRARTLGASIRENSPIRVMCTHCSAWKELGRDDLRRLAKIRGEDYSLVGRRCRCKLTKGCHGWNRFFYEAGVFRPLWTEEDVRRWILKG